MIRNNCRVCGFYHEDPPWGDDNHTPGYEICHCCGVEAGYEDYTLDSIRAYRNQWLNKGATWFEKKAQPDNWNLNEQMEKIPKEYI